LIAYFCGWADWIDCGEVGAVVAGCPNELCVCANEVICDEFRDVGLDSMGQINGKFIDMLCTELALPGLSIA
jgi:hypothetical protein